MRTHQDIRSRTLAALIVAGSLSLGAAFAAQPAAAQTAGNLKCNGCVGSKDVKNNAINSKDIKNGQVKNADLGINAVTGGKVQNGSLTAADLGDGAGVNFDQGPAGVENSQRLSSTISTVRSVSLSAPARGIVIVNVSGFFDLAPLGSAQCSVTTGTVEDFGSTVFASSGNSDGENLPFGLTRAFEVTAGTSVFNFLCGGSASGIIRNPAMTAMYFPTRY